MHSKRKIIPFFAFLLTLCVLLSSCNSTAVKFSTGKIIDAVNTGKDFHTFSGNKETVAKNEYIELSVDKDNHSIIVKDISENYTWSALSQESNELSYAFGLTLYADSGIYNLNTQDNSVAFSASSYKIDGGVLTVDYLLSDKRETAKKSIDEITDDDIFVSFSAIFTMKDQSVYMDIDLAAMRCTKGAFISDFTAMPFFGASYADSSNDYFFIPDGPGAIMYLDANDSLTDDITVNIYGENPYNPNEEDAASAILPVFGIKRNKSAFAAIISDGDALSVINAKRATDSSPSEVFSKFIVTDVANTETDTVLKGKSYSGNISIVYKFLSGDSATYSGMAAAAREEFITDSDLSSSKSEIEDSIPFSLSVVGEADKTSLTTIQQTTDILGILKGKGISNIVLSYKGLLSGGLAQNDLYYSNVNNKLGGSDGLNALYEYAQTQNCTLMLGTNIFSSAKNYTAASKTKAISSNDAFFSMTNDLGFNEKAGSSLLTRIGNEAFQLGKEKADPAIYSQTSAYTMNIMNIKKLQDKFPSFLEDDIFSIIDGITVTDAGLVLCSDSKTDRQAVMNTISSLLRAVSNYGKLCVEGGNLYTLYNADIVTNMAFDTFYTESESYESVPFAPAVLHGTVQYSGIPIDAGNPLYRYEMLRYIEYGAIPNYEWIYENANIYCYSGYLLSERITEIVDFYNDASAMLSELADDTIINHRKIEKDADGNAVSGVYCTTYSDGTEIYVNYTGNIVSTSGNIAVGPYDYVKVKR